MTTKEILGLTNTLQGVALVGYNASLLKKKRIKGKHIIGAGVVNVIGTSMIKETGDIIKRL